MPDDVHRLVAFVSGAPVGGIWIVTGVPVRCVNRAERLVGLVAARRPEPVVTVRAVSFARCRSRGVVRAVSFARCR
jgi:hypothetical protein